MSPSRPWSRRGRRSKERTLVWSLVTPPWTLVSITRHRLSLIFLLLPSSLGHSVRQQLCWRGLSHCGACQDHPAHSQEHRLRSVIALCRTYFQHQNIKYFLILKHRNKILYIYRYFQHQNLPKKTSIKIHKLASDHCLSFLHHRLLLGIFYFSLFSSNSKEINR